ncbi:thiamine pyrophosphokinase [Gordoniibacillus kamchatkensis]|uniref:Thiamine diphosphokinase n=1 Tax=Gordoniibacillus kamchatkensis TaxID=1590651 RepID=A0ABR5ACM2_9BACL|nr:thiamine diphosphokinase [Paenibacillus sp. VKM B-2647]KIL38805.1 thiamine pyrophosphokinase [Paenibacillus sp. VKM B-2647]
MGLNGEQEARRVVIASGGELGDWALDEIRPDDVLIGADRGALFLVRHGLRPMLALGDFDSVSAEELEQIRHGSDETDACDPIDKNWTDTELAFRYALERDPKPAEIVLLGALGTRFDHSLANVHLLQLGGASGIPCRIVDRHNEIRLVAGSGEGAATVRRGRFRQVSLLPLSAEVTGITLEGFQYPLRDATLRIGQSLGVSNVLLAEEGTVRVRTGLLLVIQSVD